MGGILGGMVISLLVPENGWEQFLPGTFPLGLFCLLRSAFFLYRFVKYNYYKLKCSSFEVCVIQVGFLNDCF